MNNLMAINLRLTALSQSMNSINQLITDINTKQKGLETSNKEIDMLVGKIQSKLMEIESQNDSKNNIEAIIDKKVKLAVEKSLENLKIPASVSKSTATNTVDTMKDTMNVTNFSNLNNSNSSNNSITVDPLAELEAAALDTSLGSSPIGDNDFVIDEKKTTKKGRKAKK